MRKMRLKTAAVLYDEQGNKCFGPGPYQLLCLVEKTGSLHRAAKEMDMAYSKALKLIKNAEEYLGFALTVKLTGGVGGGGSVLTPEAKDFLEKYALLKKRCMESNDRIYEEIFGEAK